MKERFEEVKVEIDSPVLNESMESVAEESTSSSFTRENVSPIVNRLNFIEESSKGKIEVPIDIFESVQDFKPVQAELPVELKCFRQEFLPAVGSPDAFLSIPRPDGLEEKTLGLKVLDEPTQQGEVPIAENGSNRLRSVLEKQKIPKIKDAYNNAHEVDDWILKMSEKRSTSTRRSIKEQRQDLEFCKDCDPIMKPFPSEMVEALDDLKYSKAFHPSLDMTLTMYLEMICVFLDVPKMKNSVDRLHLLFHCFQMKGKETTNSSDAISVL